MLDSYSLRVTNLLVAHQPLLIIPDLIMVKEGVACGDRMILSGQVDQGCLRFDFSSESACILCRAACCLCKELYYGSELEAVRRGVAELCNFTSEELLALLEVDIDHFRHRVECIRAPFLLLSEWIETLIKTDYEYSLKPDTHGNLECDACVSACRINWDNHARHSFHHERNSGQDSEYLKNWLTLGKIELLPTDIPLLRKMCAHMTEADHQFLSDYTINTFVLYHLLRYAPDLVDKGWKASAYLIQKNEVNRGYFERIIKYISDFSLDIYSVKGYVSQRYYDFPSLRIHSDYDLIAANSSDAFRLTNHLMQNGFSIRPNLFSLKKMRHADKEILSGHFHVQKIIEDVYMLELDISFPGFPINRVEIFYPETSGQSIRVEEQIIVTLLHLFKHSDAYMKDLNDLYYMLRLPTLDLDFLGRILSEHRLWPFFNLAVSFIAGNYPNGEKLLRAVIERFQVDVSILERYPGWPYDRNEHIHIKQEDLDVRTAELCEKERSYLYPIVMFWDLFSFDCLKEAEAHGFSITVLIDTVCRVERNGYSFYLTPIGILIDSYINTAHISRLGYIEEIETFLKIAGCPKRFPIPYASEHFYVRVL